MTPQLSGREVPCEARRERIMQWSARAFAAKPQNAPPPTACYAAAATIRSCPRSITSTSPSRNVRYAKSFSTQKATSASIRSDSEWFD